MGGCLGWEVALPGPLSYCVDRHPTTSAAFEGIRTRKRRWTLQMELFQSLTPRLRSVGEFMKTVNDNTIP